MYRFYLLSLIFSVFLSGCWPKGCFGQLAELRHVKPGVEKVLMTDGPGPQRHIQKPFSQKQLPDPVPVSGAIPGCTKFADIRSNNQEILIFVDKNAVTHHQSGENWHVASRSIGVALKRAFEIHADADRNGVPKKKIYIIVAGASYGLTHEKTIMGGPLDNSPIISIDENAPNLHQMVEIRGGYRSGDQCLELDKNIQVDPQGIAGRATILDGENQSNHVVDIADAQEIRIEEFTIIGGKAVDTTQAHKQIGGALLIRGDSHKIALKNLKLGDSSANEKGGCLALIDNANTITVDIRASGCRADKGGGGVYIGGRANNIKFSASSIEGNFYHGIGGGVLISDNAANIVFDGVDIHDNHVAAPATGDEKGGGVAIIGAGVGAVAFKNGWIRHNEAKLEGGGVYISTAAFVVANPPVFLAPSKLSFDMVHIDSNQLTGNNPVAKGAGVAIIGPAGDVLVHQSSIKDNNLSSGNGAGLAIFGSVNHVKFSQVNIERNVKQGGAADGVGIFMSDDGAGGNPNHIILDQQTKIHGHENGRFGAGLFARQIVNLVVANITLENNNANQDGGGIYAVNSHFYQHDTVTYLLNTAHGSGGGLWLDGSMDVALAAYRPFPFSNITCLRNSATNNGGCMSIAHAPSTVIDGGDYAHNGIQNVPKGIIQAVARGGAIYFEAGARFTIQNNARFQSNHVRERGGAVYTSGVDNLIVNNGHFSDNRVLDTAHVDDGGGAIYAELAGGFGLQAVIQGNSTFSHNHARPRGGAIYFPALRKLHVVAGTRLTDNEAVLGSGGALYVNFVRPGANDSKLDLAAGSIFNQNRADGVNQQGGAIFAETAPNTAQIYASMTNNTANNGGGAVMFAGASRIVDFLTNAQTRFENNVTTTNDGGGVLVANTVNIKNANDIQGSYIGNSAANGRGGALAFLGNLPAFARFKTANAVFDSNVAPNSPVIYLARMPAGGLEFYNTRFVNTQLPNQRHVAMQAGGLMEITTPIRNLMFRGSEGRIIGFSTLAGNGGAFYAHSITNVLRISGYGIEGNTAENGAGGFLYVANPSANLNVEIRNARFFDNKARNGDGGVLRIPMANDVAMENSITVPNMIAKFADRYQGLHTANTLVGDEKIPKSRRNEAFGSGGVFWFGQIMGGLNIRDQVWLNNQALNGDGGALYVNTIARDVIIKNPMHSLNIAGNHGGAVYIGQARNISLDATPNVFAANKEPKDKLVAGDIFGDVVSALAWKSPVNSLNNFGLLPNFNHRYRGQFLIEENQAANGNGGAFYIGGANSLVIDKIPFRANEAGGVGGTIYADNLRTRAEINRSIIFSGVARDNAGGVFVRGSNNAGDSRELEFKNSSIQQSRVLGGVGTNGSAGLYAERTNSLYIAQSNFYDNQVTNAQAGTTWAAAVKLLDRPDPLPAPNVAYNQAVPVGPANMPLAVAGVAIPAYIIGPVELEDNVVRGHIAAGTIGAISIPQALKNSVNYFIYNFVFPVAAPNTPFSVQGNVPAPLNAAAVSVVQGH
jgi:hypothetical protein